VTLIVAPVLMKQFTCAGCKRLLGYVPWRHADKLKPGRHFVDAAEFHCPDCDGAKVLVRPRMMELATR
jgi:DNA-directed RNA polymerase subunit RPC12/RpoP